eukprot:989621-Prymnesium_polylepis.1
MPQRPCSHGLGVGRIGGNEGFFRLDATEVLNSSAAEAPPAEPLPALGAPQADDSDEPNQQRLPS